MIPALEPSPAEGARVAAGELSVSFGLGVGNTLRLSIGTVAGGDDVGSFAANLPTSIDVTVPSTAKVLFCSAWVSNAAEATHHTYTWAWSVGAASRVPAQVEHEAEVGHLLDHWNRPALAAFAQGIEVPDPGHGHDEISPVTYFGQPFNVEDGKHIKPFTPEEVAGSKRTRGTGYLRCLVKPLRPPVIITPGYRPEYREDVVLEITIVTPKGRGPKLANLYAGILAMLYRLVSFRPEEAGISIIRNLEPPAERAMFIGDDGTWRYDRLEIPLSRFGRAEPAGAH